MANPSPTKILLYGWGKLIVGQDKVRVITFPHSLITKKAKKGSVHILAMPNSRLEGSRDELLKYLLYTFFNKKSSDS